MDDLVTDAGPYVHSLHTPCCLAGNSPKNARRKSSGTAIGGQPPLISFTLSLFLSNEHPEIVVFMNRTEDIYCKWKYRKV